jgi:hypothetical protein
VIDVDGVVITVPNRIQAYMGDSYAKVVRMPLSINPIQLGVNYLSFSRSNNSAKSTNILVTLASVSSR